MNDKQVFERFMEMAGMKVSRTAESDGITLVEFKDVDQDSEMFTKEGYDEFYAGAAFNSDGSMIRGYLDSHVAYVSDNGKIITSQISALLDD